MESARIVTMAREPYDEARMIRRRGLPWIVLVGVLCAVGALAWWLRESPRNRDLPPGNGRGGQIGTLRQPFNNEAPSGTAAATGTSGTDAKDVHESATESGIIREIETITGSVDGHELIGRRINLTAPVQERANDE